MLDALVRLEEGAWGAAKEGLTDPQLAEVHKVIDGWLAGDEASRVTDITRLPGFVDITSAQSSTGNLFSGITDLVRVDPLSGLDPAVREVAQVRQLGERAFYYLQHVPELMSTRVELMALRSSQSPEVAGTLASVERVSEAAASLAATAEALPAQVSAEREAALAQVSAELTAQREGLVRDLETAREPLGELLVNTRGTVEATRALSESLTETLRVLDAFVGRFAKKEGEQPAGAPAGIAPAAAETASTPPGRPFDITEYGAAAEQIGAAVRDLGTTIATLDKSLPQVQQALAEAAAQGERSVDHVFESAYRLLAAALAGSALTVLLVRWISSRTRAASERSAAG
jgi:ABC-type transporter Mla subunit MlaD